MDPIKILLVDDSKSARYALRLQLQRHGAEVETADSAESAFEILKHQVPDAILLDHMMPGLNGFEALEVIREDSRTAHVPVVMCTSHEDQEFAAAAMRKGVVAILPKSDAPEKLPEVLAKLHAVVAARPTRPVVSRPADRGTAIASAGPASIPVAPVLSQQDIERLIDSGIESRVTSLLARTIEDLRHDLIEHLSADTRALLDTRLAREHTARDAENIEARLHAAVQRLTDEVMPQLVKRRIEAERAQIHELVKRTVDEHESRQDPSGGRERPLDDIERLVTGKTQEAVRRESHRATEQARQVADVAKRSLSDALARVYIAIFASAAVGVGAAIAVYALLR